MTSIDCHKHKPHAAVLFAALACAVFGVAGAEPFTADPMWGLKRIADPPISPHGPMAAARSEPAIHP